jgi:hypothetical protein
MTKKCTVEGKHVRPCSALEEATEFGNPPPPKHKRTGIFAWALTDRETGQPSRTLWGAKTSQHPNGVIFNFCPWCGADLQASHA